MCTTRINSDKLKTKLASLMLSAVASFGGSISVFAGSSPVGYSEDSESGKAIIVQRLDDDSNSSDEGDEKQSTFERDIKAVKMLTNGMNESNFLETAIKLREIFSQGSFESDFIRALERNARNHFGNICEYLNVQNQNKPFKVFDSSSFNLERIRITLEIIIAYVGG